jgi:hypothetical protein
MSRELSATIGIAALAGFADDDELIDEGDDGRCNNV